MQIINTDKLETGKFAFINISLIETLKKHSALQNETY